MTFASALVVVFATATLGGCGSSGDSSPSAPSGGSSGTANVVASTNVYGDIVRQIAGDRVHVTSIITDPEADPHSYEANTQNQLELSRADIVIENGGGYDDFIDTMLKAAKNDDVKVLDAVDISGVAAPDGGELNEHVWYDLDAVEELTDELVGALSTVDPAGAPEFQANASAFKAKLQQLRATEASIKEAHSGAGVAITEPVPLYMLEACGLVNKTPDEFSEAIEEGSDVSPAVLKETLDLFTDDEVELLAYNEQTAGPETEQVLAAAKSNEVAVVPVTETLPSGDDYIGWMTANLSAIQAALA